MRTTFACLIIAGAIAGCQDGNTGKQQPEADTTKTDTMASAPADMTNKLTDAEKNEGWQLLFDGASKSNFHVFNNKSDGSAWQVTDGALHLDTTTIKDGKITGAAICSPMKSTKTSILSWNGKFLRVVTAVLFSMCRKGLNSAKPIIPVPKCRCWIMPRIPMPG